MADLRVDAEEYLKNMLSGLSVSPGTRYKINNQLYAIPAINVEIEKDKVDVPFQGEFYDDGYMLFNNTYIPMSFIRKVTFKEYSRNVSWMDPTIETYWAVVVDYGFETYSSGDYSTKEKAKAVAEEIMKKALPFIQSNHPKPIKEIDV